MTFLHRSFSLSFNKHIHRSLILNNLVHDHILCTTKNYYNHVLFCRFVCLGMLDPNLSPNSDVQQLINDMKIFFSMVYKIDVVPNLSLFISTPQWRKHMNIMDRICTYVMS